MSGEAEPAITMRSTKAEIFAAYKAARRGDSRLRGELHAATSMLTVKPHRPMEPMVLARLIICENAVELARWVIDRESAKACFGGDDHARDTMKAMHLFEAAQNLLTSEPTDLELQDLKR